MEGRLIEIGKIEEDGLGSLCEIENILECTKIAIVVMSCENYTMLNTMNYELY